MEPNKNKKRAQYLQITDVQKEILLRYFDDKGMTNTRKEAIAVIKKAAEKTGLCEERVKKWICNEKARLKRLGEPSTVTSEPPAKKIRVPSFRRGSSAYNVFCSEYLRSDECKQLAPEDKYKMAGEAWRALPQTSKDEYQQRSKQQKNAAAIADLDEQTKIKLIQMHKKQMLEQAYVLEDLGCESAILFLENRSVSTGVDMGGSSEGSFFLRSNPSIYMQFAQHFSVEIRREYNQKDVQELFNDKYSKAMGKQNLRVPYEKRGFKVVNLPQGIDFKKPCGYGNKQIKKIMEAKDDIYFEISDNMVAVTDEATSPSNHAENTAPTSTPSNPEDAEDLVYSTISCIVGRDQAKSASKDTPFSEESVEVENLVLNQTQRLTLYSQCRDYFSCDAWIAIGANIKLQEPHLPGVIIPVYTNSAAENFWLFYTEASVKQIEKITPNGSVRGFWLDVIPNTTTYKLLKTCKEKVYGKNIIKSEHGPIFFCHRFNTNSSQPQIFSLPAELNRALQNILTASGFIS